MSIPFLVDPVRYYASENGNPPSFPRELAGEYSGPSNVEIWAWQAEQVRAEVEAAGESVALIAGGQATSRGS